MSKRLRASMRAANKGRNLRPRNSVPHGPPTSDAPPGSSSSDPLLQLGGEDDDGTDSERDSEPASLTKPSLVAVAGSLKGSSTHAEMPAATAAFSAARAEEAAAADLRAEQAAAARAEAARAEEAARAMRAQADELRKSEEAARVAREKAADAARAEESARAAREKAEDAARLARAEDARKAEDAARARKADEAAKVAKVKADEGRRAEETAKAAKARSDDGAKGRARDEARKPDTKKGTPARVEEARSKKGAARPRDEDDATSRKAAGAARPVASATSLDDDQDPSSISAEFFRKDEDSVPPVEEGDDSMVPAGLVLSPAALARRARLRRLVAGVVSFAAVISIAVVGKTVAAQKRTPSAPMPVAMEVKHDGPKAPEPAPVAEVKPAPVAEAPKTEPAKVDDKKAEEPAKADDKKADDKKAEEPAKAAPSGGDADALRKETESLLNRGKRKEAIEKAREAIAADPSHAMAYLFLGSALQDSGKWKDGIEAYSECVRNATKGPVNECRAMGGHK